MTDTIKDGKKVTEKIDQENLLGIGKIDNKKTDNNSSEDLKLRNSHSQQSKHENNLGSQLTDEEHKKNNGHSSRSQSQDSKPQPSATSQSDKNKEDKTNNSTDKQSQSSSYVKNNKN